MSAEIPAEALALRSLVRADQILELFLDMVPMSEPGPDEVLIRVEAAPLNPSDMGLLFGGADMAAAVAGGSAERPVVTAPIPDAAMRGLAGRVGVPLPVGNEGAGTVVAAGESAVAQALLGKVVAAAGGGMYSQYRPVNVALCLELPAGATAIDGAASFVNPMTVLGMVETMRLEHHSALVHTAAASNLGQMLNRVCLQQQIPLVNIVRTPDQGSDAPRGWRRPRLQFGVRRLHGRADRRAHRNRCHAGLRRHRQQQAGEPDPDGHGSRRQRRRGRLQQVRVGRA